MHGVKHRRPGAGGELRVKWQEFARLLSAYYRERGYRVELVGDDDATTSRRLLDASIDLTLRRANEYVLVQCQYWNQVEVSHKAVTELRKVMLEERASSAMVVTGGTFTASARDAAACQPTIQLLDGLSLLDMLGPLPLLLPLAHRFERADPAARQTDPDDDFLRLGGARYGHRAAFRGRVIRAAMALSMALGLILLVHIATRWSRHPAGPAAIAATTGAKSASAGYPSTGAKERLPCPAVKKTAVAGCTGTSAGSAAPAGNQPRATR